MKLLRLAVLTTGTRWLPEGQSFNVTYVSPVHGSAYVTGTSANINVQGHHVMLTGALKIRRPRLNRQCEVMVPGGARRFLEYAIEHVADIAALSTRSSRQLSSPFPWVALTDLTNRDRTYLSTASGFANARMQQRSRMFEPIDMSNQTLPNLVSDRHDGLVLLAEALSAGHPSGQFREYLRVFERAFKLGPGDLAQPLTKFLRGARDLGYTKKEVDNWMLNLRGPLTHADRRASFVVASDIAPIIWRVEQAAYDVLLNKRNWRSPDHLRRVGHKWVTGTGRTRMYTMQGRQPTLMTQLLDGYGAYPCNFEATFRTTPTDWWVGQSPPPAEEATGIDVRQALDTR